MTWESQPAWLWLSIEAHLAVVCASAPALKTFFKHTLKDYTYGFRRSGKSSKLSDPESQDKGRSGFSGVDGRGGFNAHGRSDFRGAVYDGPRVGEANVTATVRYGGGRGDGITALPKYNLRGQKNIPWEIRVDSEHELVYTKGKPPSLESDEFYYGHRF